MSEYIEIETEAGEDEDIMYFYTNLKLADTGIGMESYDSLAAMEEGSPVAQALSIVQGIRHLRIEASELIVTRDPNIPWHIIVADVSAILKDFFL